MRCSRRWATLWISSRLGPWVTPGWWPSSPPMLAQASAWVSRTCGDLRRAGHVHDLGRMGVPNRVWSKTSALSTAEQEHVRLHPYLTQRILTRVDALRGIAQLAGAHHERLDGSGYPLGASGAERGCPNGSSPRRMPTSRCANPPLIGAHQPEDAAGSSARTSAKDGSTDRQSRPSSRQQGTAGRHAARGRPG